MTKSVNRRIFLLSTKIKNIIKDLQNKTASNIVKKNRVIFLPIFEVSKMVKRNKKKNISKKTVNEMELLNHYKFKEKIKE